MPDRKESDGWLKAFLALPKKNRVALVAAATGGLIIALVLFFSFFFRTGFLGASTYPQSNLAPVSGEQPFRRMSYETLPTAIQFPGTSVGVNVGGNMLYQDEGGASFFYDEDTLLVASVGTSSETYTQAVETKYPSYLKKSGGATYSEKKYDKGFTNSVYCYYHAGTLDIEGERYYLVSYACTADEETVLYISYLTGDKDKVRKSVTLLGQIMETFRDYSESEAEEGTE